MKPPALHICTPQPPYHFCVKTSTLVCTYFALVSPPGLHLFFPPGCPICSILFHSVPKMEQILEHFGTRHKRHYIAVYRHFEKLPVPIAFCFGTPRKGLYNAALLVFSFQCSKIISIMVLFLCVFLYMLYTTQIYFFKISRIAFFGTLEQIIFKWLCIAVYLVFH